MKNLIKPKLLQVLRDAGLQQEEPKDGQVWYDTQIEKYAILIGGNLHFWGGGFPFSHQKLLQPERFLFHPDLEQMLILITPCVLDIEDVSNGCIAITGNGIKTSFSNTNLLEACVKRYLFNILNDGV